MPDEGGAQRRVVCDVCGYAAVGTAQTAERCPNCGAELSSKLRTDRAIPREAAVPSSEPDLETWPYAHPDQVEVHGPIRVEFIRRRPPPGGGYRDSAEISERIRIRHRMTDWSPPAARVLAPTAGAAMVLVMGGGWVLAAGIALAGTVFAVVPLLMHARKLRRDALELHPEEIVIASRQRLPASRVRAVEHHRWGQGLRIRLVLDSGERVTALEDLNERQADYVARLIEDTLGLRARSLE